MADIATRIIITTRNEASGELRKIAIDMDKLAASASTASRDIASGLLQTYGIMEGFSKIKAGLQGVIAITDDYRQATIAIASSLTETADQSKASLGAIYATNLAYAQETYLKMGQYAAAYGVNVRELGEALQILSVKGIVLTDAQQMENLAIIASRIKMITRGQVSSIQMSQELRAAMSGQSRATDQLAIILRTKLGPEWQKMLQLAVQNGTVLQFIADNLKGTAAASRDIQQTWYATYAAIQNTWDVTAVPAFQEMYADIVRYAKELNQYLIRHKDEIVTGIRALWRDIRTIIEGVASAVRFFAENKWARDLALSLAAAYAGAKMLPGILMAAGSAIQFINSMGTPGFFTTLLQVANTSSVAQFGKNLQAALVPIVGAGAAEQMGVAFGRSFALGVAAGIAAWSFLIGKSIAESVLDKTDKGQGTYGYGEWLKKMGASLAVMPDSVKLAATKGLPLALSSFDVTLDKIIGAGSKGVTSARAEQLRRARSEHYAKLRGEWDAESARLDEMWTSMVYPQGPLPAVAPPRAGKTTGQAAAVLQGFTLTREQITERLEAEQELARSVSRMRLSEYETANAEIAAEFDKFYTRLFPKEPFNAAGEIVDEADKARFDTLMDWYGGKLDDVAQKKLSFFKQLSGQLAALTKTDAENAITAHEAMIADLRRKGAGLPEAQAVIDQIDAAGRKRIEMQTLKGEDDISQRTRQLAMSDLQYQEWHGREMLKLLRKQYADKKDMLLQINQLEEAMNEKTALDRIAWTNQMRDQIEALTLTDYEARRRQIERQIEMQEWGAHEDQAQLDWIRRYRRAVEAQYGEGFEPGFKRGLTEYVRENTKSTFQYGVEVAKATAQGMSSAFENLFFDVFMGRLQQLQDYLTSFLESVSRAIAQMFAQQVAVGIVTGFYPASAQPGYQSPIWGGPRAAGGPVASGRSYLVGERGPELFTPGASGAITPNGALAGGNVRVIVNNNTPQPATARATPPRWNGREWVIGVVIDAYNRNSGGLRSALGGA